MKFIKTKKFWIITGIVLFVFAAVWLFMIYDNKAKRYEKGVAYMQSGLEATTKHVLGAKGGTERTPVSVRNGQFGDSFLCISVSCPEVTTTWILLADKGKETQLRREIVKDMQLRPEGAKWAIGVLVGALGKDERPYEQPEGKEWYNIYIYVTAKNGPSSL